MPPIGPALDQTGVLARAEARANGRPPPREGRGHRGRERPREAPPERTESGPAGTELPHHLIDRDALEVVRRLRRNGHTAYLVGGCVRDLSLGLTPKDFDVATSARPEEIRSIFRNCRIIGRRFRLAHIYFRGGKIIETSTFRAQVNPGEIDEDGDESPDLLIRHDNVFGTAEEDARRRDFTINGLFYDPASGRIIDYVGGIEDLKNRTVRMIGNPDIRLREDPVRILRAIRIAAKTNLAIDGELLAAMARHKHEIVRCAKPRILEETMRLFRTGIAQKSLELLVRFDLLDVVLPRLHHDLVAARLSESPREPIVYAHLSALDARVRQGPASDAVVLGALYAATMAAELDQIDPVHRTARSAELLAEIAQEVGATRKISERLRQIILAQRHFDRGASQRRGRRKPSPHALAARPHFSEALDLYEIVAQARGEPTDEVDRWRGRISGEGPAEAGGGEGQEGRSRRRRRRRRGGGGSGEAAQGGREARDREETPAAPQGEAEAALSSSSS